eukprot:CAMPEP_0173094236 /NCGR_PEP_ID=MMETSP1102-20130122/30745_1 /TAXON_ID=49646 /ORGANISM="Geminigera sp., Strain Caron Lab Isolate" /LENGTH=74 /DNA_ID=CAMNT_0013982963 /DNA_START=327 /DNA_END=548 /DNA_ORIENTATION=+
MTAALADRELALHKILGDPERAVYLKTLRQRVSFQWTHAISISALKQWAQTIASEKLRLAAKSEAESAASKGSW